MELRHLRHFVAVAEELHFARAADRLGMEQSPLSHSIRNLEADLGVALFHRTTRRTWLTRAGSRFYKEAVRILEAADHARLAARNGDLDRPQKCLIGLAEHSASEPFTRLLVELEQRSPAILVDLQEVSTTEIASKLLDRSLDMVVSLKSVAADGLQTVRAWSEPLSLLLPLGHRLAERSHLSLREAADDAFVLPHAQVFPGCEEQLLGLLDRHGVQPSRRTLVKHQNTMISLVASGRGVSLLPTSLAYGLTTLAAVPLIERDAVMVSWLMFREGDDSDCLAFAREVATAINGSEELPSSFSESSTGVSETPDRAP